MLNACFVSVRPLHGAFLKPEEASRINLLMRMNYETMHLFTMSRLERNRCLVIMNDYYRLHLPDFPVLKSLDSFGTHHNIFPMDFAVCHRV